MAALRWLVILFAVALVGCGDPNWSSGDRVLVTKTPYDLKIKPPERYDVVVFKFPGSRSRNSDGPLKKGVPINYIKRLLGLPGEVIAIFFGQLFRIPLEPGEEVPGAPVARAPVAGVPVAPDDVDPLNMWQSGSQPRQDLFAPFLKKAFETGRFGILRKPPVVMLAERRIVYDNDYQASDLKVLKPRWDPRPGSNWKASPDRRTFLHANDKRADIDWLTYQHLPRPSGPIVGGAVVKPQLITDYMGYNGWNLDLPNDVPMWMHNSNQLDWSGNLMLEANVTLDGSGGELWMEVNKGVDRFQAKFELKDGKCTLYRVDEEGKSRELASHSTNLTGSGTHLVRFANFDARLTVWVDGTLPFGDGAAYDPVELGTKDNPVSLDVILARCGPRPNDLARPASIGARDTGATIANLRLWRDTYYTMNVNGADVQLTPTQLADPEEWGAYRHLTPTGLCVYPGHYLCMGDNSTSSSDSRAWGLVPERLMLGRALAVYFPIDRAGLIR